MAAGGVALALPVGILGSWAYAPASPHQRAIRHGKMRKRPIIQMNAVFKQIKPGALSRQILALTAELEILALENKPVMSQDIGDSSASTHR